MSMEQIYLLIVLAPLAASLIAGLFGGTIGRVGAHSVTILGVGISCACSLYVLYGFLFAGAEPYNGAVYTWLVTEGVRIEVGFLVDRLTALMMSVVTFVSLMVHIYTIGYMADDEHNWPADSGAGKNSYQRFFSYISLFTFSMLMLVMANNFLQLFFGWEAVGLVSYLLIGFWLNRSTAVYANLKAFMVNRVGDFGFILGIAGVFFYTGSLDYATVFDIAPGLTGQTIALFPGHAWSALSLICILLFIGAMGKSAQFPLHVWLPDSMEGPTPISALIHAATMVTAGIFMVARMSPLFELSTTALSVVLVIGAITAFFMGLLGVVATDIKRVIAYSTLSQLGYMTVALGASAYGAAIFHLMTHAFFKALLFLAAGSVIIALHHEQDMRQMGGLRKYMPITYWTTVIGSLALIGFPGFAGFFSKDVIIEAVHEAHLPGADFAYAAVLGGVFITALYSFRLVFMVFHGRERFTGGHGHDAHGHNHAPQESPWVVTLPLILLAIPSALIGWWTIGPVVFGDYFGSAIFVAPENNVLAELGEKFHGAWSFVVHGLTGPAFWLAMAGLASAWYFYLKRPELPARIAGRVRWLYRLLVNKYFCDEINDVLFARGGRRLGTFLWQIGDMKLIDGGMVNGSARLVAYSAGVMRHLQSGYLYHYAFAMIIGLSLLLGWFLFI